MNTNDLSAPSAAAPEPGTACHGSPTPPCAISPAVAPPATGADRKTRSDARLDHLPPALLADLHQWLDDGLPLETIAAQLQDTHQIAVSLSTLSRYRHRRLLHERQAQAAAQSELLVQLATRDLLPLSVDPERLQATLHLFFLLQAFESADLKAYLAVSRLELARQNLELRHRQLDLQQASYPTSRPFASTAETLRSLHGLDSTTPGSAPASGAVSGASPDTFRPAAPHPALRSTPDPRPANTCKQPQTPPAQAPVEPATAPITNYGLRLTSPISLALPGPADTFHPLPGSAPVFRPADPALLARVAEICQRPIPFANATPHPAVHIKSATNRPAA